eukprot:Opistho-2@64818
MDGYDAQREREEVADMLRRGDEVTNESLEATRRMRQMAEQSREVGAKTLEELNVQGEKLNRIDNNLDKINADMRQAERHITNMEKCCGLCVCPCNRHKNFEKSDIYLKSEFGKKSGDNIVTDQPRADGERTWGSGGDGGGAGGGAGGAGGKGGYINRITNDAREDEMDENIGAVSNILGDLKAQAHEMSSELDRQNDQLDRLNGKTDVQTARVKEANLRTTALLKSA